MAILGEDVITANGKKNSAEAASGCPKLKKRKPGTAKGQILYIASDFDELPVDFKE